jgi:CBS-domain-containing membrane protein
MLNEEVEHVPVVDAERRLLGICTRTDLLKVRRTQQELERTQSAFGRMARRIR